MFHLHINQQILLAWPGTPAAPVQWSSSLLDSVAVSPQETVNQERAVAVVTASGSGQAVIIATDGVAVISIIVIAAD